MKKQRSSAPGTIAEQKEVVVTLDRRLLYLLALFGAFGLAVAGGFVVSRPKTASVTAPTAAASAGSMATPDPLLGLDEASARATAQALGLPTGIVIVTPNIVQPVSTAGLEPGGVRFLDPDERAAVTPGSAIEDELLRDPDTEVFEVNPDPLRYKDHEVLSNSVDPNVDKIEHRPLRLETVSKPVEGPRLALSDLNLNYTYDFGVMKMTDRASHEFVAKNVGTEPLIISRVYTGCGCTATTIGGKAIPPDGVLPEPLELGPGEQIEFSVEFDARAEGREGAVAKYVQIFTNDPTYVRFADEDPNSHETRFRIVVEPKF